MNAARFNFEWIDTRDPYWWKCEIPPVYTVDEFTAEFDRASHVFLHGLSNERFVYSADFSSVEASDPRNRARVALFLRECAEPIKRHIIAWGIVAPRPLMRGAITAVTWLGQFPVTTRVFAERTECDDWLAQQLAIEQLNAPKR